MSEKTEKNFRKIARNFKGRIELMRKTPLEKLESMFLEIYDLGMKDYIRIESERYPHKTRKEIILDMYEFHEKMKKRKWRK